ncbi:MAG: DUF2490 domain-containing protein [Candidatus Omnitrophota bacterium]
MAKRCLRGNIRLLFLVVVIFNYLIVSDSMAFTRNDAQLWTAVMLKMHMSYDNYLYLGREFRFGNHCKEVIYRYTEGGVSFEKYEWVHIAMLYRYGTRKKDGVWEEESTPHLNVTFIKRTDSIFLSTRNRIEYEMLRKTKDIWRYRNKIIIGIPMKWNKKELRPYVADEFFIDFDQDCHNINQISGGIRFELVENFLADVFCLWQSRVDRNWESPDHVVGMNLELTF